ncbi:MAG: PCMD domain-containing protein [Dysgonamonadaceae bacterium]|nr:PCMD domain-containing protein [Dysgonamonadaceae bacterium]MDD4728470.1 PCMD domain-containing protein [Dysgonamonadaceae bacterium]
MNKKLFGYLFLIGVLLAGCSTEDHFGQLSDKEILEFQLEEQVGNTKITDDTIINVTVPEDVYLFNLTNLSASSIKVSDFATVSPKVGEKQDFSQPVAYTVTAEDGSTKVYYVTVLRGGDGGDLQLPNSSFELWHDAEHGETKYIDIGLDKDSKTWATGNQGAGFAIALGANAVLPSLPYKRSNGENAAELATQNMGQLAAAFGGKGVAAGSIFTGRFEIGIVTNAHPVFGVPYTQTPIAFEVDYKYSPAEEMLDGKLNTVEGKDAMDMYLILEKREGKNVKRLGVGWFRSGEEQADWKTQKVDIKYAQGKAPEGIEEYAKHVLKYGHDGNPTVTDPTKMLEATWGDITTDKPTHILVVFTSSYQGDYFIGAPGSKLLVDNFKLIY